MPTRPTSRKPRRLRDYVADDPLAVVVGAVLSAFLGLTGVKGTSELAEIRKTLVDTSDTAREALRMQRSTAEVLERVSRIQQEVLARVATLEKRAQ